MLTSLGLLSDANKAEKPKVLILTFLVKENVPSQIRCFFWRCVGQIGTVESYCAAEQPGRQIR